MNNKTVNRSVCVIIDSGVVCEAVVKRGLVLEKGIVF